VRSPWRTALLLLVTTSAAAAPAAFASPVPIQGMRAQWDMRIFRHGQWLDSLGEDCIAIANSQWGSTATRREYKRGIQHWLEPQTAAVGAYDGVSHAGEVHDNLNAFELVRTVPPSNTLEMNDVGIELAGGRAYVTAVFA
jgi:hypothetical protein